MTKRVSTFTATIAGSLAVVVQLGLVAIPGVNAAYLATVTLGAGLVALAAASLEAQSCQEAAVRAKTRQELRSETRRCVEVQAEVLLGTFVVTVPAVISRVFTRIKLPARLQTLNETLRNTGRELAKSRKPLIEPHRSRVRDLLVKTRQALQVAFDRELRAQQQVLERIKALRPDELVEKLAQGDEALLQATGLTAENARALQRLGKSGRGRGIAKALQANAVRALEQALGEMQAQMSFIIKNLGEAAERVKAARSVHSLREALTWAGHKLDPDRFFLRGFNRIVAAGRRFMEVENAPLAMASVDGGGTGGKVPASTGGSGGGPGTVVSSKKASSARYTADKAKELVKQGRTDGVDEPEPPRTSGPGSMSPPPAGLPAELAVLRKQLTSPEAIAQFDAKYQVVTRGKPAPTHVELKRFRDYLDSKGSTPAELDARLAAERAKKHPSSTPPTGNAVDQLPGLRELVNRVVRRIEHAKRARPELVQGLDRLLDKILDENKNLVRMERGQLPANNEGFNSMGGMRNNIEAVEAELDAALRDPHAVDLSRYFPLGDKVIEIDRITNGGDRWVDVKNYKLFGEGSSNMRKLMAQAKQALQLAEVNPNPATGKIPEVVYEFSKGVTPEARRMLETVRVNGRGIKVIGKIKSLPRRGREAPPQAKGDTGEP